MTNNLAVLTPSYKNTVSNVYLDALLGFTTVPDFRFRTRMWCGESLITRARNMLFSQYVAEREEFGFTHLLWLDDDIYVDGAHIKRLCDSEMDVVGIPVPLKRIEPTHGISCAVNGALEVVDPYVAKVRHVGTGAVVLSNRAVDALVQHCESTGAVYSLEDGKTPPVYDVFRVGLHNGLYRSEDWYMCDLLIDLGFSIYVDSSSHCVHADGLHAYDRPALPMDPRAVQGRRDALPENERMNYWTPNDWGV